MAGTNSPESRPLDARKIRAAAIIQNIVRYYVEKDGSTTAPRGSPVPQQSTATSGSASPSAINSVTPSMELPKISTALPYDPTLTAFAQLAAIRLNCDRSCISLIDHKHQYVIAEGTPSVSLHNPEIFDPGDELFVGPTKREVGFGVCPDTMRIFEAEDDKQNISTDNLTANQRCYVINDLAAMDCYEDKPYVSGWPYLRFYAEVPLKLDGHVIGSICVLDGKPGCGLDGEAQRKLTETASVVAEHLNLVNNQTRLRRSQKMVRGLGRFVDGKSAEQWWNETFNNQLEAISPGNDLLPNQEPGFAQTLSTASEHRHTVASRPVSPTGRAVTPDFDTGEVDPDKFDSLAVTATHSSCSQIEGLARRPTEIPLQLQVSGRLSPHESTRSGASAGTPLTEDPLEKENVSYRAMQSLFSRASALIRESSELSGIIFVDASLQDIAVTHDRQKSVVAPANAPRFGEYLVSALSIPYSFEFSVSDTDSKPRLGIPESPKGSNSSFSISVSRNAPESSDLPAFIRQSFRAQVEPTDCGNPPICNLLGYSLQTDAGHSGAAPTTQQLDVPQSTLRSLLRSHPDGHVYLFNADGSLLDGEEVYAMTHGKRTGRSRPYSRKSSFERDQLQAYQLLKICPGARGIVFFPLWDPQRDQWYAGSLAWTNDPARILQSEDVTFLAAFGSCIMAEKSKLDALKADRAKSDFISSVSHELRSPLHGILATVEALAETEMNMEQDDLIRTVSTCGEVLMDTMDHILDYAKMSNSKRARSLTMDDEPGHVTSSKFGKVTSFDLSNLVERVVEGIFAGHNYRSLADADKHTFEQARRAYEHKTARSPPPSMNPNVMVIVDIERQLNWLFESQIGAWKRILTNLFGNALKYTEAGFIRVSLAAVPIPSRPTSFVIALEIQDSGIGMTQDFLKHRLYTPFAQENPMSVGTGLGLSIVRQLINDLSGTINIDSEAGHGTQIKVSIPSTISASEQADEPSIDSSAAIRDIRVWCIGLKICLIGFDYYPDIEEAPTGILGVHASRMLAIRSSMTALVSEWFGMEVVTASSFEEAEGDFLMVMQSYLVLTPDPESIRAQPVIVFEDKYCGFRAENGYGVFHLSQPVGPYKLARILGRCLEYRTSAGGSIGSPRNSHSREERTDYSWSGTPQLSPHFEKDDPIHIKHSTPPNQHKEDVPTIVAQTEPSTAPRMPRLVVPRSLVLLVEDNSVNMKILVYHMKRAKEQCVCAENGLETFKKYQAEHQSIKVIFMDIAMPIMDGIAATKEIRKFERENSLPRVRIVALTCFSSEEYKKNTFDAGVDMFLIKPVPMKFLKPILAMDPDVVVPPSRLF